MLHYLKKNWRLTTKVCFLLICEWGMQALVSLIMIRCFDAAFRLNFHDFLAWISIDLVAWAVYFLISMFREIIQTRTVRELNNDVRHDLYLTLLQKKHMEYHMQDSGEYISWFTNDIKQIETLIWQPFFSCVGHIAQVVWCILALTTLHWSLAAVSIIIAIVTWLAPKAFQKKMAQLGDLCSKDQASALARLKDLLSGYNIFQQFQKQARFVQDGDVCSDAIEKPVERINRAQSIAYSLLGYLNVASQFLTDILIVFLASKGIIGISVFGGGANLVGGVATGLNQIAKYRISFSAGKPYFDKILYRTNPMQSEFQESEALIHSEIVVENLSYQYTNVPVLQNVCLRFEIGGKYALVGPSGCGKSTLLKILLGWLPDYSGTILIDGKDIRKCNLNEIQKKIGYIEQDVFLFNTTIRENITLGGTFTDSQLQQALQDSALIMDIDLLQNGLDTIVGEGGSCLSGGQKQRVAIARALIHNRTILFVDEGTSALDQANADIVEQSLLENHSLTLLLVSHHLSPNRKAQFTQVYEVAPPNKKSLTIDGDSE